MKNTGYLLLFFLTLYATSCGDMSKVTSSRQGSQTSDIKPMRTSEGDENVSVIGWQLGVKNNIIPRSVNKQAVEKESSGIEDNLADLERDITQVTTTSSESNAAPRKIKGYQATRDPKTGSIVTYPLVEEESDLERDETQATADGSESDATQRKIKGYQATRDLKTGRIITYPIYEDEEK